MTEFEECDSRLLIGVDGDDNDESSPEWGELYSWPSLDAAAYHGLIGEMVDAILPQTEADPAALIFTALAMAGNVIGADFKARVGDDDHTARLSVVVAGDSANGVKGTSYASVRPPFRAAHPEWFEKRILNGFGSGEGLLSELSDSEKGEIADKRLFVLEPELARILAVAGREGNTLSAVLRLAWDGGRLSVRRAKDRIVADGAHISIVGHITPDELRARLAESDLTNGFANRFLFVCSRRSKKLPSGGYVDPAVIGELAKRISLRTQPRSHVLTRTPAAEVEWERLYMAEPDRDGIIGSLTARSHAQRLRLAVAYAALDGATKIEAAHIRAAQACWAYNVQSIEYLFGGMRGDRVQDQLLAALRDVYPGGLTGREQDGLFAKNLPPGRLAAARESLTSKQLIRISPLSVTGKRGRPGIISHAIPVRNKQINTDKIHYVRVDTSPSLCTDNGQNGLNDQINEEDRL